MHNKRGNFFGILLALLMLASFAALLTSEPEITGFSVVNTKSENLIAVKSANENQFCIGNLQQGTCSRTKPLFCNNGDLIYNCDECGCNEGFSCGDFGVCESLQKCADGSFYGECSFLNGKFCQDGSLINNCQLCGCNEGETCSNNKCTKQ